MRLGCLGATPTLSANGTSNGILWVVEPAKAILHAYSANNLATELYNGNQNSARDALGSNVKFAPVTVAASVSERMVILALLLRRLYFRPNAVSQPLGFGCQRLRPFPAVKDLFWRVERGTVAG